jgi:hypothetical protein
MEIYGPLREGEVSIILSVTDMELLFVKEVIGRVNLLEGFDERDTLVLKRLLSKIQAQQLKRKAREDFVKDKK